MGTRYRRSTNDLDDYDDAPRNVWDRDRFEQVRYERRDSRPPAREREVILEERPARPRYVEERVISPPRFASRVRQELYDDYRPETSGALQPYRRRDEFDREYDRDVVLDVARRREYVDDPPPRPGLLRRQSSLDTFDRRPAQRYQRDTREIVEPVATRSPPRRSYREEDFLREPPAREEVRDVEIVREREVRRRPRTRSDVRSVVSDARSARSSHTHHTATSVVSGTSTSSRSTSPSPVRKIGKRGHTRLPKGQFKEFAIKRLNVDYSDDGDFYKIHRALDKDTIDSVLAWSRETKESKVTTYKFDGDVLTDVPKDSTHYEKIRTEWINPPSVRAASPARSYRTVRAASPRREEIRIVEQTTGQPPAPPVVVAPGAAPQVIQVGGTPAPPQNMTVAIQETTERSHRDIEAEIRRLQYEKEIVRLERDGVPYTDNQLIVQQPYQDYQVVQYRPGRERGGYDYYVERDRSPPREVVRVEKDRKGRMALVRSSK